ncbi:MAG: Ldh family oxidoreductase, partial [Acidobacteriota bacterium]|nr:Ldh family oxidoreductase [Acidobacteriota bacterium]
TYLAELDGGRSRARPELSWQEGAAAVLRLDAGGALGLVAGRLAGSRAVHLARTHGVGAVSVVNSNHFGPASCYSLEMARHDVLGLALTNSDALVAPHNGTRPLFGTNPLSLAVRGLGDDLFCADLATSQVSYSRVKLNRERGEPLLPGWAVGEGGVDAAAAGAGEATALKPLGGHKGQCLGMMVSILCCLLAGAPFDHELSHLYAGPWDEPRQVAHLFVALDLAAFGEPTALRGRLSSLHALVRSQPAAPGEQVVAPGDLERAVSAVRQGRGIPLDPEEWERWTAIAHEAGQEGLS